MDNPAFKPPRTCFLKEMSLVLTMACANLKNRIDWKNADDWGQVIP
jgi:hypothetical protein